MKTTVIYCDRCGKEVKNNKGSLRNEYPVETVLLVKQRTFNTDKPPLPGDIPDVCEDCFQSLQSWYSDEGYIGADQKWNISTDVERMNVTIQLMAGSMLHDQYFDNCTEDEIAQSWMDEADKFLEKQRNE